MDNGLWKLQQEARVRVASQRAREHRVAADYDRRTAATLRAARPPQPPVVPPPPPPPLKPQPDREQMLLLTLALLLAKAGANKWLVLAILYLAM
ncbi:MAG: hypothetical protein IJE00_02970 [Clostridia bacterium]|nr:hypothetical protein [Clostridia bacterium]